MRQLDLFEPFPQHEDDGSTDEVIYRKTIRLRNGKVLTHPTGVFRIVIRRGKKR